jgi:RHH-type proline utilization regulon transcriptional repressor/proline dehydrogenase/delta 1-pyrroline-5-carboxylate dehydrogenase
MKPSRQSLSSIRKSMREITNLDEARTVKALLAALPLDDAARRDITRAAADTVRAIRSDHTPGIMEKFLAEYGLNTDEGVALMCLAEAYLRTPDSETLDALISDKIGEGDWARHLGRAQSSLVNASTWALMLTGKVFRSIPAQANDLASVMHSMVQRLGEPVARTAVGEAMKVLGAQFVLGRDIEEALKNARPEMADGYLHSFDMLGEAARTANDAKRYFLSYSDAISEIAKHAKNPDPHKNPGISVKLSALHPRYETVNRSRVMEELVPRVTALAMHAKAGNIPLAIDAEEADRLDLSLDVIEAVLANTDLKGWSGFGVVVQAYSKRCPQVLDWLYALTEKLDRRISVRLVKGAYWDAEIKNGQVLGLEGYPVFTRKESTDISYLANAARLLAMTDRIYPQFATHNAHTVVAIEEMAPEGVHFEFQRLHGMGDALHEIRRKVDKRPRRIYAPVGIHKDLLAYLVRRLLENGANSSFVNQVLDKAIAPEEMAADPLTKLAAHKTIPHHNIPLPAEIFPDRKNSRGWNLNNPAALAAQSQQMEPFHNRQWTFAKGTTVLNPAMRGEKVGSFKTSDKAAARKAVQLAKSGFAKWSAMKPAARAKILDRTADLYEENHAELMAIVIREAGKTRLDAVAEIREAVDFLRYYAAEIRAAKNPAKPLGPIVCISPWNFPCAIFTGQISGALSAGNTVIAKPAEQTPLIAEFLTGLFHQAGVPDNALLLVQGEGTKVGPELTGSPEIAGVAFTGSTQTARHIDLAMARGNPNAALIAETGGLNAMIVDSTALPEQAVRDIVASAFQSAGQRCSALRVLYVQKDVAPQMLEMLKGAAEELNIGDPWDPATDVGPVIDAEARNGILAHCEKLKADGRLLFELPLPEMAKGGTFVAPVAFRLNSISELEREIFGPVLHVIEFDAEKIDQVVKEINATGYGLTMGVHSRIDTRVDRICAAAEIGNIYVNRNQIGAVVGVQPFGGEGLSGTGPKAGGPLYARRFTSSNSGEMPTERTRHMPGPTGERNTWSLIPRGLVACLGPDAANIAEQGELAKAAGNKVTTLADHDGSMETLLNLPDLALVLYQGSGQALAAMRHTLSARKGKRVLVIDPSKNPEMLFAEKAISEDTTASGGNASLLASVG